MTRAFFVLFLGLLCVPSSRALAQDDAVDRARASFFQGVELYKEGSFEAALAEFQKAYATAPTYRVLYNIAQTYFELHDYVSSAANLEEFVQQGGDAIPVARRAQVDDLNRKLEKRIGYLEIVCDANDADIRIDDLSVGSNPLAAAVPVNAGPRRVSAIKPGYAVVARLVTVAGAERAKVKLELGPPIDARAPKLAGPAASAATVSKPDPSLIASAPPRRGHRSAAIASLTVAGGCAVASGIFGWQLLVAKNDFDREVAKTPFDRGAAERVRSRALTYEYLTDGFAAAALLSGGVALYLALTGEGRSGEPKRASAGHSVALIPAGTGVALHGSW